MCSQTVLFARTPYSILIWDPIPEMYSIPTISVSSIEIQHLPTSYSGPTGRYPRKSHECFLVRSLPTHITIIRFLTLGGLFSTGCSSVAIEITAMWGIRLKAI